MENLVVPVEPLAARATISDVARRAGVSRQTVSRVARGVPGVSPATAARVQRVIDQLGYRPHAVARALSSGTSRVIGVLTHDVGNVGAAIVILSGVERAASEAGYTVNVVSIGDFDTESVHDGIDRLLRSGCDGIVLMATWTSDAEALRGLPAAIPVVATSQVEGFAGPCVYNDTESAARLIVTHLLELGHRTVHHVAGPAGWSAAHQRARGWRNTLEEAGAPVPPPLTGNWTAASGYQAGVDLARDHDVTAVFAANDDMALGVIHGLTSHGRSVPHDVSVVGFDNSASSAHFLPPLTTVGFDSREHSERAVDVLLAQIAGRPSPAVTPLSPVLAVRESTAPPPAQGGD